MPAIRLTPGLPVISDGHQLRIASTTRFSGCDGQVHRLLLIDDAAVTLEHGRRQRLDPPVLLLLPPGWSGTASVGRGAFCYRIEIDGGPALSAMLPGSVIVRQGSQAGPWSNDIIALAQRWWRSLPDRHRVAVHLTDLLLRLTETGNDPDPARQSLEGRFHSLLRTHLGSTEGATAFARRLGVSRATLDRALMRSAGTTAAARIRQERLRAAATMLLQTDQAFADIGGRCGFADVDSFVRAFKRIYGCTPRAWRRRQVAEV